MDDRQRSAPSAAAPAVTRLPHEIDAANAQDVREQLAAALLPGTAIVIADMTATTFCDSSGVRALALAHKEAAAKAIDLRFVISAPEVLRILSLTGLDQVLRVSPSLDAALAGERPPGQQAGG